jgi:hypothetical protein
VAQTAAGFEVRIYKALRSCSGNAKGLFLVMRYFAETNLDRPGYVERDGCRMTQEALAEEARCQTSVDGPDPLSELIGVKDEIGKSLLLEQEGRTFVLPLVRDLHAFRRRRATSKAKCVSKKSPQVLRNTQGGVTSGVTTGVTSPPMVSPPITPSSLSPPPTYLGGGAEEIPQSIFSPTQQAFDRWSNVSRGHPCRWENNEWTPLRALLLDAMQSTPIARGGEVIPRQNLVPQAADWARENGKDFKGIKYAAATVKNLLDEWAKRGMPGIKSTNGHNGAKPKNEDWD